MGAVEGTEQAVAVLGVALEELLRLAASLLTEVGHEQVGHLPTVALFFGHDAGRSVAVVLGRSTGQQVALLFDGGEFGVALNGDHGDHCVAHVLLGDLHGALPLRTAGQVTGIR